MWFVLPLHLVIIVEELACPVDSLSVGGPCCSLSSALPPQTHDSKKGCPTSCPPGGEGRKPCGNGPPLLRPDGVDINKDVDEKRE
jgi:hypothetical protein